MFPTGDFLQGEVAVGIVVMLINIGIHAVVMGLIGWVTHRTTIAVQAAHTWIQLVLVTWAVVSILTAAHLIAILVWAVSYYMVGIVPDPHDTFYFAFANYTTLGYGDIMPVKRWRLLGPMTAMNGMLLFGWSAAVIFDVLRTITRVIPEPSNTPE
jgi:hypothetical protein